MQSGKIGHFDVRFVKERIFMKTLKDLGDLKGKRVLVRADFNVPLDGTTITDDGRIKAALPTIKTLREEGAKVILMAHLGRPKGKVVPELSLAPVAARLGELLGANVPLAKDTYGEDAQAKVAAMNDGDVVLLENVRFNPEETSKDADERAAYAKKIAALGEAFVSDGFGVVHRAQGSNYDVAADLPAAAGKLVEKEVKALSKATENPERPFTVVLGGSKVSDKLGVIENLLDKANRLANFDDANMRRSAKAAAEASEKVQHAFEVLGDNIPDNLRQAGQLRIDHVDKSLEELGKIAEPQITKDAIAGRIRRLLQLAEKTEKARAAEGK